MGGIVNRLEGFRRDVDVCVEVWSNVLRESLGSKVLYAYLKGSTAKRWDTFMDYVPLVSDVDIHVKVANDDDFFPNEGAFDWAMDLSASYEERFKAANPSYLHIPRTQIMIINEIQKWEDYVPPAPGEVRPIIGEPAEKHPQPPEEIRQIDLKRLRKDGEVIGQLHKSVLDRTGLDFWVTIRQHLNYRVSPSPYRLLSQLSNNPLEIWTLNRTTVHSELRKAGYDELGTIYKSYYRTGWELFDSGMNSYSAVRKMVSLGYHMVATSLGLAEELQ
jgi:hypothetical protein